MTLAEFNELYEKTAKEEKEKYEFEKEQYTKGIFTEEFKSYDFPFKIKTTISSEDLVDVEPIEAIKYIQEFLGEVGNCTDLKIGDVQQDSEIDNYESDFASELQSLHYYQDIERFDYKLDIVRHTNRVFKSKITKLLKPKGEFATLIIECKFLQLYKNGILDWKELQNLVYSNCSI